jgi:hypothetical protein
MPRIDDNVAANLPRRTGVTLREWVMLLRMDGPAGTKEEQVAWLRERYGLGKVQAAVVADQARGDDSLGAESAIQPIADKLLTAAQSLGVDVRVEPHRSYVPLIRRNPFAVVTRAPHDRIDLGLALPGTKQTGSRLIPVRRSDSATRITHHVEISRSEDVDAEVLSWLRKAYELDA